jgi:hypothetical protein
MRLALCVTFVGVVVLSSMASADPPTYLPLHIGNQWSYDEPAPGQTEVRTVTKTVSVRGHEVFAIEYGPSAYNAGLENYWTNGPDGDVLLWGFWRKLDLYGYLYDPPIVYADGPLSAGKTWTTSATFYALPDTTLLFSDTFGFEVYEAGVVVVPLGAFFAYGVGQYLGPTLLASVGSGPGDLNLLGERDRSVRGQAGQPSSWYSEQVGVVQDVGGAYKLRSFDRPTATTRSSWGAIKLLYH